MLQVIIGEFLTRLGTLLSVGVHVCVHMPCMPPRRGEMTLLTEGGPLDLGTLIVSLLESILNMGDLSAADHVPPNVI